MTGFHLPEKLWTNENAFYWPENQFPPAGMKDFVEKYFSTWREKTDRTGNDWEKEMLSNSRKIRFPYHK